MMLLQKACGVVVMATLLTGHAASAQDSRLADQAVLKTIDALVSAMNKNDDRAIAALMTADAVMQDEIAPYRWLGPNAEAKWSHDDAQLIAKRGVTQSHSSRGVPTFVHRTATHAFATVPLVYTYMLGGRPQRETGLWTIVFAKSGPTWQITFLGFAKVSDTSDATWNGQ